MNRKTLVSLMIGAGIASTGSMVPQQAQADWGNLDIKGMMRTEIAVSLDGTGNPNNTRRCHGVGMGNAHLPNLVADTFTNAFFGGAANAYGTPTVGGFPCDDPLSNAASTLNMFAARMEIDFTWRKNDNWSGFAKLRGWTDLVTLIDQGYEDDNVDLFAGASFDGDGTLLEQSGKYHILDFAVAYVDYTNGPLWLRVGKQQIAWGESFGFRTLDMVNSLDLRRHLVFDVQAEEFADERIATLGIRASYSPPGWDGWELEGFLTQFTPTLFAPQGSPYSNIPVGVNLRDSDDIDNARQRLVYGGRLRGMLGNTGVELQFNFVSRPQQLGVFEFAAGDLQNLGAFNGIGTGPRDVSAIQAGGTSNIPIGHGGILAGYDNGAARPADEHTATYGAAMINGIPLVAPSFNAATDPSTQGMFATNFGPSIVNIMLSRGDVANIGVITAAAGGGTVATIGGGNWREFAFGLASASSRTQYDREVANFMSDWEAIKVHNGPVPFSAGGDGFFYRLVGGDGINGAVQNALGGTSFIDNLLLPWEIGERGVFGLNPNLLNGNRGFRNESEFDRGNRAGQADSEQIKRVLTEEWNVPDYANCSASNHAQITADPTLGVVSYNTMLTAMHGIPTNAGNQILNGDGSVMSCDQLMTAHGSVPGFGIGGIDAFLAIIESTGDVTRKFPRVNIIGAGFNYMFQVAPNSPFNYVFDGLLFKGEGTWAFNKEFTNNLSRRHHKNDEQNWSFLIEKYHKFTYDFPALYMVIQFNHRSESNGFDQYSSNIGDNGYNLIAMGLQQQWLQNKLRFDFAGAYDFASNGGGWFIQPGVRYKPYEQLQLDLYWNHFEGNDDNTFGAIDRNDEIFTRISRFF